MEGWLVASKGLGPLPRMKGSALAHGCGRDGRVVLPVARAAAIVRVRVCSTCQPARGYLRMNSSTESSS